MNKVHRGQKNHNAIITYNKIYPTEYMKIYIWIFCIVLTTGTLLEYFVVFQNNLS